MLQKFQSVLQMFQSVLHASDLVMRHAPYDRVALSLCCIVIGGSSSSSSRASTNHPRFSSSIVTHNANDISLGLDSSLIQQQRKSNIDTVTHSAPRFKSTCYNI